MKNEDVHQRILTTAARIDERATEDERRQNPVEKNPVLERRRHGEVLENDTALLALDLGVRASMPSNRSGVHRRSFRLVENFVRLCEE